MTNCFPQHFVATGQFLHKSCALMRKTGWLFANLIFVSITFAIGSDVATAQTRMPQPVPLACLDDHGNPVEPLDGEGTWAVILNFNHPASTQWTRVCWAVVVSMEPEKTVQYDASFQCRIVNNINKVEIGNGQAPFDGNFRIRCPRRRPNIVPSQYDTFIVHAKARFPQRAGSYQIFRHRDIQVDASFEPVDQSEEEWLATLTSTYNNSTFTDSEVVDMVPEHRFGLQSTVLDREATHHINRHITEKRREIERFTFDYTEPFVIGAPGDVWTLFNMIIDPPDPDTTIH